MDIGVLGPVALRAGSGEQVPVAGARLRTLLTLLALDANRAVSADRLVDGIWVDDPPAAAGNALQALVSRLRRAGLTIEATAAGYRLVIEPDAVDAHRFERLVAQHRPREALALWRGPLELPEAARAERVRLEQLWLGATRERIAAELGEDRVPELEQLVDAYPLDEPLAALLMRALVAAGSPGRALDVFERTRRRLAETLGADPSAELAALHLEVLRGPVRGNLPAEISSFVGRDADVRTVRDLIAGHRLVTLTGPGGSGKTRLSVEIGPTVNGSAPDGVWRVELARVTDPAEVPQAILTALGLRGQVMIGRPGHEPVPPLPPVTRLTEAVAHKKLLLILDNCEHLIDTTARVADALLRAAPGLRLLATSREPLGLPGERLWPVEPLALPPDDADASVAAGFPAVRMLLDRAAGLTLSEANTAAVVRICRALDGMPLAIELAAARLRTLPVDVLASRLTDRFRLLTGGSRTALPRHRTLRAVVDWSWDLLDEPERRLWRRFALFPGGADVTGVERMCGADVDLLGALVDKSLLVLGPDGRYRMLETIREYGMRRLADAGEVESMRRAMAAYLLDLASRAEPELRRGDQLTWLRRLTEEHDNLHACVRAAIQAGDAATATALTARLGWYWWLRGHRVEGAALAADVLAVPGASDPQDRALSYAFAALNGLEGAHDIEVVKAYFRAAERSGAGPGAAHPLLRLLRPLAAVFDTGGMEQSFELVAPLYEDPDPWMRAVSRMIAAQLRLNFGHDVETSVAMLQEALDGFRSIGERWGVAFTLSQLADLAAARGDFPEAVRRQRQAIALVGEIGINEDLPQLEVKLAHQLSLAGEKAEARRVLARAEEGAARTGLSEVVAAVHYGYVAIAREDGATAELRDRMARAAELVEKSSFAPQFKALTRSMQGLIEAAAGELAVAREFHAAAVTLAVQSRDAPIVATTLVGVADLALREGDPVRAARLLGAAEAVRGSPDRSVPDVDRVTAQARAALGDAGFAEAFASGSSVTTATAATAAGL